ncbi:hypothetical protein [Haloflavibacter putidus]|uniref:Uncharacterized protein n=1 Tax=Haloflavibacter putidus TaxID=2576776 RepID=A0A507ZWI4_9FLAO|nr:hypothetical protein [Haloflavibacter putidus]TQD40624.1 hypothetical protein FKR84_01200 [Haloflavibacter putidus]
MKSFLHTGKLIGLVLVFLLNAPWSAVQAYNYTGLKKHAKQESLNKAGIFAAGLLSEEYFAGAEDENLPDFKTGSGKFSFTEVTHASTTLPQLNLARKTFDFRYNLKINLFPFHTFL